MDALRQTVLYEKHRALGAKLIEFGGWDMPVFYPTGIVEEHLATRKGAGLFDISHMGRFDIRGEGALKFLNHVLTNNAEALDMRMTGAQYTLIADDQGHTIDDAYLYRFSTEGYLLVVNAANAAKDWAYLEECRKEFPGVEMEDVTDKVAMISLQGPRSRAILEGLIDTGRLPEPMHNAVSVVTLGGAEVRLSRTGYTGESLCFELFLAAEQAAAMWDRLVASGATPVGLGARDTLRLEAGLPLYGHELGLDAEGRPMPLLSCLTSRIGVSFSPLKGPFIGRDPLARQFEALSKIMYRDYSMIEVLPRLTRPLAVAGRGIARQGAKVFKNGKFIGWVTSGTMVPYWVFQGEGINSKQTDEKQLRSICMAYLDSDIIEGDQVSLDIRGKQVEAVVVPYHLRNEAPPFARPILYDHALEPKAVPTGDEPAKVRDLLEKALRNTIWRQEECINLIPSEMTASPMTRLLSIMDPAFRYAEHRKTRAFYDAEVYYYQGTAFIEEVEAAIEEELRKFLGCTEVEARLVSGQMANAAVFSALVDYRNRTDRKSEPARIRQVLNHHLAKGGHLSAQPMGALKDFVARDPHTERPAVVHFPVLPDNPYKVDVPATLELIDEFRPELIIFGKSMILHKEPLAEIRRFLDDQRLNPVVMYDMAHVLGLVGPHFQQPFQEGADLVTGSTHKTYFGTQRGIVASRFLEEEERYELWEALVRRTFPGSLSNHHLGTLLGLLVAAYEMNYFKDEYQRRVIANAKAFARAMKECGLDVAGDPAIDFTETHQVIVRVGYSRGPEMAERLEANNIICNFQATPDQEGFTVSGALRMGVSEMTRFGMEEADFRELAVLVHEIVAKDVRAVEKVKALRARFQELQFCFREEHSAEVWNRLRSLI